MTLFQEKIHSIVKNIPAGKVMTYKELAQKAGFPKAWRSAGNVLAKNRDPRIPCHRVIKSNGEIGGYNKGKKKKMRLLQKESGLFKKQNRKIL